jgi:methylmalonyl-CoA decarboxylase
MTTPPTQPLVTTEITKSIGRVIFSNPPANALSHDVCAGLVAAIDECEKAHVRVVILRAHPKSNVWSAGHDIKEIPLDGQDHLPWTSGLEQLLHRVRNCRVPVMAMVHASVWGAACDLTATCDLVVGTPQAHKHEALSSEFYCYFDEVTLSLQALTQPLGGGTACASCLGY